MAAATDSTHPPGLLDRVRDRIRLKHYSIRTEQAYVDWIRRFILFHGKQHPAGLGAAEVEAFLTHLAVDGRVSSSTQNQAKSALLFLYRETLRIELPWLDHVQNAKTPDRLPVVLTRDEVTRILKCLDGVHWLLGRLLYGTGMRIMEGVRLRVTDVDFVRREILVRNGKGAKDRVTMLPRGIAGGSARISRMCVRYMRLICDRDAARSGCRTRSRASIRRPRASGVGSTCSPPSGSRPIRAAAMCAAITWATRRSSARCARRCAMPASPSSRRRTHCAIRSQRICWSRVTISARSRSC
jgi:hypothetical protein